MHTQSRRPDTPVRVAGRLTLLVALLLTALPWQVLAAGCAYDDTGAESSAEFTVRKAEKCVAGDAACCRELTWIAGVGPADLAWIPEDLSVEVDRRLARLCAEGDRVSCWTRPEVLVRLGQSREAIRLYSTSCLSGGDLAIPGACEKAGDLLLLEGREREAQGFLEEAGSGSALRKAGSIREAHADRKRALEDYDRGCEKGDNEACARARRLSRKQLARDSWEGLYGVSQSENDSLWIQDLGHARIRARFHTTWANGHTCDYEGEGIVRGDRAIMDPSGVGGEDAPVCRPVLVRQGGTVTMTDPGDACRRVFCGARGVFEAEFPFRYR